MIKNGFKEHGANPNYVHLEKLQVQSDNGDPRLNPKYTQIFTVAHDRFGCKRAFLMSKLLRADRAKKAKKIAERKKAKSAAMVTDDDDDGAAAKSPAKSSKPKAARPNDDAVDPDATPPRRRKLAANPTGVVGLGKKKVDTRPAAAAAAAAAAKSKPRPKPSAGTGPARLNVANAMKKKQPAKLVAISDVAMGTTGSPEPAAAAAAPGAPSRPKAVARTKRKAAGDDDGDDFVIHRREKKERTDGGGSTIDLEFTVRFTGIKNLGRFKKTWERVQTDMDLA